MRNPQRRESRKQAQPKGEWCTNPTGHAGKLDVKPGPKYKRLRVRCPTCKRRVIAKVYLCSCGSWETSCCIEYQMPPHKTK